MEDGVIDNTYLSLFNAINKIVRFVVKSPARGAGIAIWTKHLSSYDDRSSAVYVIAVASTEYFHFISCHLTNQGGADWTMDLAGEITLIFGHVWAAEPPWVILLILGMGI